LVVPPSRGRVLAGSAGAIFRIFRYLPEIAAFQNAYSAAKMTSRNVLRREKIQIMHV
jgi:ribosomal protein L20A (L18A)